MQVLIAWLMKLWYHKLGGNATHLRQDKNGRSQRPLCTAMHAAAPAAPKSPACGQPVQNHFGNGEKCGFWRIPPFHRQVIHRLWVCGYAQKVPVHILSVCPPAAGFGQKICSVCIPWRQESRPGRANIKEKGDFLHRDVDVLPVRPQFFQTPKGRRIKGLRRFSTVSTSSTPTSGYKITTTTVLGGGQRMHWPAARPMSRKRIP